MKAKAGAVCRRSNEPLPTPTRLLKPLSDCVVKRLPWNTQQGSVEWINCTWDTHCWGLRGVLIRFYFILYMSVQCLFIIKVWRYNTHLHPNRMSRLHAAIYNYLLEVKFIKYPISNSLIILLLPIGKKNSHLSSSLLPFNHPLIVFSKVIQIKLNSSH